MGWVVLGPFDSSLLPVTYAVLSCLWPPSVLLLLLLLLPPCQQQAISLGSSQAAYSPAASFCQLLKCCSSSHIGLSLLNVVCIVLETPVYTGNLNTELQRQDTFNYGEMFGDMRDMGARTDFFFFNIFIRIMK